MDPGKFKRVKELFRVAAEMPKAERQTFLETVCPDDSEVRNAVQRLIDQETVQTGGAAVDRIMGNVHASGDSPAIGPGTVIGPYVLRRKLGEGGMGLVFEAEQREPIHRTVALKVIKPGMDSAHVLNRFQVEREALALMNHPNIAKVLDAGATERGQPYFVMEHVAGIPVSEYCDKHNLTTRQRLELFIKICDGIHHAHQKGIIHRDVKPTNILVSVHESGPDVKIIDFGVARAIDRQLVEATMITEHAQMVGTPEYMSPEQAEMSNLDIDTRTDIYSLGVVLYELLVGRLPFSSAELRREGLDAVRRKIREEDPPKPSTRFSSLEDEASSDVARRRHTDPGSLGRQIRGELDWITMKAMEKDRARRYGSASDLAQDIRRYINDEPVTAGPPSAGYRARKFVHRHRFSVALTAAIAASLVVGLTLAVIGFARATRAERAARFEADTASQVTDFMIGLFSIPDPNESRGRSVTAKEVLDRGTESIRTELTDRPALRARLLDVMGRVYRELGLYGDAGPLLETAVANQRIAFGEQSPELARSLSALAGVLLKERKGLEAEPLLREALAIQEAVLPEGHPDRALVLNNLGHAMRYQNRPEEAVAFYGQSFKIRESVLGPRDPELVNSLNSLASMHGKLGDEAAAMSAYERALLILDLDVPPDEPKLATVLNNVGSLHRKAGRYDLARKNVERALSIREQILGPEHPETVTSLLNLALIHSGQENDEKALELLQRAAEVGSRIYPPRHRRLLDILQTLETVREQLERSSSSRDSAEPPSAALR